MFPRSWTRDQGMPLEPEPWLRLNRRIDHQAIVAPLTGVRVRSRVMCRHNYDKAIG